IMDKLIAQLPAKDQKEINKRYEIVSITPEKIKFMDRIVLDSRDVALGHTAGISGPQQSMMSLFSIFELIDDRQVYKKAIQTILDKRINNLYNSMGYVDVGIKPLQGANKTHYYALLDLMKITKAKYGPEFAQYLAKNFIAIDFLFKLAQEKQVVCLPGQGFKGPDWSIRVSLANLNDDDYTVIGQSIREVMDSFYQAWQKKKGS
ncbi:aspartate 4-decarboxylase, partial [bacterium]|nr:aspartate 4-decarboxylase [bacterium]